MLRRMQRALCILVLSLAGACDGPATKTADRSPADKGSELPAGRSDALAKGPGHPDSPPSKLIPPAPTTKPRGTFQRAPARACALIERETIDAPAGHATLSSQGDALHVWLGYQAQGAHQLARVRVPDGAIEASVALPSAVLAAPSVASDNKGGAHIALLLGPHAVSSAHFDADGKAELKPISSEADTRFRPALLRGSDHVLIAYTRTVKNAMHVEVARVSADKVDTQDVTPVSHGASAPTFVLGAKKPTLIMIDARAGVSPLLEVAFDAGGQASEAVVRTPVSQPYNPTELWAVEVAGRGTEVAFTAIGRAAATAVGRVGLRSAEEPVPLLPSLGYGQLRLAAVTGARRAVFVLQSPSEAKAQSPLNLEIVVIDAKGEGPRFKLDNATTSGAPSIVALETPGHFAVLHRTAKAWELVRLVCDA
jgi:hypothetical protein